MLFMMTCTDKPDSLTLRLAKRDEHLEYLKSVADKIVLGGPFMLEDGETPGGSMIIFEADDMSDIEAIAQGDPYTKAELFKSVTIHPWIWTLKPPED